MQKSGTHLVENIRADIFGELDWIDPETKEAAIKKVKNLRIKVGYMMPRPT